MKTTTVNISFQKKLLAEIDRVAGEESRSRSELIREAARHYIERKKRWNDIFAHARRQARQAGLTETDVGAAIAKHRRKKRQAS